MSVNIVLLSLADAAKRLDGFVDVYREAFSGPPYNRQEREVIEFARALPLHTQRPGFRSVAAISGDGEVAGFAYGYYSLPGQWWHDNVSAALGRERSREWLGDAFQLTELAVRPECQGQRLGSGLHDLLLSGAPNERAVLSTLDSPTRAWDLYQKRGWEQLLAGFHFPGVPRPYAIFGRMLPLNGAQP